MDAALAGQSVGYDLELPITPLGARAVSVNYVPEHNEQGDVIGFVAAILDVTVRQHAEKSLRRASRARRTISGCNQLLVRAQDEATLMNGICRLLVEQGGSRMTSVSFAERTKHKACRPVARPASRRLPRAVESPGLTANADAAPTGTAIRSGNRCWPATSRRSDYDVAPGGHSAPAIPYPSPCRCWQRAVASAR